MVDTQVHELKTWPRFFEAVVAGRKTFEVRWNDRGFEAGDLLELREWRPGGLGYTGNVVTKRVAYVLKGGEFGVEPGYVVLGLEREPGEGKP